MFFCQAEDGIRDDLVTGVQTCALPIFIVMDAPPERERCEPFIDIANRLLATGVNVPKILEVDAGNGFILLSDLGSSLYLDRLNDDNANALYDDALAALLVI